MISGVDLVDGTPILDIKPYIPSYDMPVSLAGGGGAASSGGKDGEQLSVCGQGSDVLKGVRFPAWSQPCMETTLEVMTVI